MAGVASGLEGVVAAETLLSDVDGEAGRLILAGHDVEALADRARFEDACGLLWSGKLPPPAEREALRAELGGARARAFQTFVTGARIGDALALPDAMSALRAALGHLPCEPTPAEVTAATAVFAAAWARSRSGLAPVSPAPDVSQAADLLRMIHGAPVAPARVDALDAYLVTVIDHGMNASTFAARVVASTGSDIVSAIVAAVGALKGPLHGGAPGPVLDMLDAIAVAGRAPAWIAAELAAGRRIMGMGHRIYRVRDPRAAVLERAIERLRASGAGDAARLELARAVEREATEQLARRHPTRALRTNVEFYTAVLLDSIGVPREIFSATFGCGRVAGWCAHVAEQRSTGRLIRPASRYVGPPPAAAA